MATKRGKRPTKKVKSLKSKSLSAGKAKHVRGGSYSFGAAPTMKIADASSKRIYIK